MKRSLAVASTLALAFATSGLALAQEKGQTAPSAPSGMTTPMSVDMAGHAIPANKLIGADVTNGAKEQVGSIDELLLDKSGQVKGLVVSVGGFLGVGDRKVVLPWDDMTISRNGDRVIAVASATKDELKAMPEYKPPKAAASKPMDMPARSSSSPSTSVN
jgi:hypothetical protein